VVLLCIFTFALRYAFFSLKYGLNCGAYPLQSLSYYSTAEKSVSLMQTFIYTSLIKLLGYMSFAALVLFISVCVKQYALTLLISTATILIPFIGIGNSSAKYIFTGPLGLMLANGFFRGNQYQTDTLTNEVSLAFKEIPISTIFPLLCVATFITILMLFILVRIRSNVWHRAKRNNPRKAITAFLLLFATLCGMTGCSSQNQSEYDVFNYHSHRSFQNASYRFYVDETDVDNIRLVFENLETGEVGDFVKTPLQSSIQVATTVYGNGNYVYYIKYCVDNSGFREAIDTIAVIEVDTQAFNERVVYEKNINAERSLLMGTLPVDNSDLIFLHGVDAFFVDDSNIYFIGNGVRQVNRATGAVKIIDIPTNVSIAYDGRRIYFIGDRYQLTYYDTTTDDFVIIPEIVTTRFYLADGELLFLNRLDEKKLYALCLDDFTVQKILDKTVQDFYCDDEFIYYQDIDDLMEYTIER